MSVPLNNFLPLPRTSVVTLIRTHSPPPYDTRFVGLESLSRPLKIIPCLEIGKGFPTHPAFSFAYPMIDEPLILVTHDQPMVLVCQYSLVG